MATYTQRNRVMTDQQIADAYAELRCSDIVGFKAGCSSSTVLAIVRRLGLGHLIGGPGRGKTGLRADVSLTETEIIERYRAGESAPQIARAAGGVGPHVVYGILKRAGVPRRSPGFYLKQP